MSTSRLLWTRLISVLALGVGVLVLGASHGRLPAGTDPAVAHGDEFSSWGSADLHAFHHGDAGVLHALYLESRWEAPELRKLHDRARAWRQTMTVQLPQATDDVSVVVDHWASDLPQARVKAVTADTGYVTFTVTTEKPTKLRAGRLYRTQVLVLADRDLDGSVWHYSEQVDRRGPDRDATRFTTDESSAPRRGTTGWCSRCYVVWGEGRTQQP